MSHNFVKEPALQPIAAVQIQFFLAWINAIHFSTHDFQIQKLLQHAAE
jgi:hypothetical protein